MQDMYGFFFPFKVQLSIDYSKCQVVGALDIGICRKRRLFLLGFVARVLCEDQ